MDFMLGSRRRSRASLCTTVAEYAGLWGWTVVPGARVVRGGTCSCGAPDCAAPGAHPLPGGTGITPGTPLERIRSVWEEAEDASVLLRVGVSFDVIDVGERAGARALARLERMGTRLGPVLATPTGRALFFVAPGAAGELPELLYRMGWDDADLDLRSLGPGDHVTAPPSDLGSYGPVRWLRRPAPSPSGGHGTVPPPEARLVLGTLAYACHRERRSAASRLVPS
ncbi:bifunctional DNA primase/polymerase [Streptomyces thermolineatus]|uniref:bifunctional DNA primase/polymerase n=1 Tax=Streptomyces thermolineatus TaxID=44033 RepID=UPI00384B52DD